jgi:hypothetical protein
VEEEDGGVVVVRREDEVGEGGAGQLAGVAGAGEGLRRDEHDGAGVDGTDGGGEVGVERADLLELVAERLVHEIVADDRGLAGERGGDASDHGDVGAAAAAAGRVAAAGVEGVPGGDELLVAGHLGAPGGAAGGAVVGRVVGDGRFDGPLGEAFAAAAQRPAGEAVLVEVDDDVDAAGGGGGDDAFVVVEVALVVDASGAFVGLPVEDEADDVHAPRREGVEVAVLDDDEGRHFGVAGDVDAAQEQRAVLAVADEAAVDVERAGGCT